MNVAEQLRPYLDASSDGESRRVRDIVPNAEQPLEDLMERAVTLITVMPWNQRRETIEDALSPYDPARGRRAVDALIEAALVAEDNTGHLRLLR